jgi:hypothetical protein
VASGLSEVVFEKVIGSTLNSGTITLSSSYGNNNITINAVDSNLGNFSIKIENFWAMNLINKIPRIAPNTDNIIIRAIEGGSPIKKSAGAVKMTPAANPSPTDATVCTILLSKIDAFLKKALMIAIDITAAGIDAETVVPTFKPR